MVAGMRTHDNNSFVVNYAIFFLSETVTAHDIGKSRTGQNNLNVVHKWI